MLEVCGVESLYDDALINAARGHQLARRLERGDEGASRSCFRWWHSKLRRLAHHSERERARPHPANAVILEKPTAAGGYYEAALASPAHFLIAASRSLCCASWLTMRVNATLKRGGGALKVTLVSRV